MLEVVIIICLAIALFLLLRHYPDAKTLTGFFNSIRFKKYFGEFARGIKKKDLVAMQAEIEKNNQVVAPSEVEEALTTFKVSDPEIARMLHLANEAYSLNDLRAAEDKAIEAISQDKRCAEAYVIIGKIAYSRGQFEDAESAFKTALKCDDELGEAHYGLGKIEFSKDNLTGSLEHLQKAIMLEKGHADWYADLGKAYVEVRQFAKAAKAFKKASNLDVENKEYKDLSNMAEEKIRTHSMVYRKK